MHNYQTGKVAKGT